MNNRTFTFVDIYDDLLKMWRQEKCTHFRLDFTKKYTKNNKDFWADGICLDCGTNIGHRIFWSE